MTSTTHSRPPLQLNTNDLSPLLSGERLGSLNRSTDCTVDDELRKDTNGSGNTEENSVVVGLSQTVVLEEDTGVGTVKFLMLAFASKGKRR